ncbi:glucan biosynthesis protein D, partial [Ralstonia pseudosolanacearum]
MHRRDLLKQLAAGFLALAPGLTPSTASAVSPASAATEPFDEAWLRRRARALAAGPYRKRNTALPPPLAALGWDAYQSIGARADHALWAGQSLPFDARFFHLGLFFKSPVRMHEVAGGQSRVIAYDPAMFDYGKSGLDHAALPADLGFAGFRLTTRADPTRDVAAFLGASYFRAVGGQWQYGMSARGLAIDTGLRRAEEFPDFTEFWLVRPAPEADTLRVYALLDAPSVAGAYRFDIRPGDTLVMDVQATLFVRKPIERLGIAPLTSMFLYGENDRTDRAGDRRSAARRWRASDWRPEIHDSDGLAIWRGSGEWIWRPLANPPALRSQRFADDGPRGFGL